MAETKEAERLGRIWKSLSGKIARLTKGDRGATELYVKLESAWKKAGLKGDLGLMHRVISWGDELKAPFETAEKAKLEAVRQKAEAKAAKQAKIAERRRAKAANQQARLDEVIKNLKPGQAPVGVETQGLTEAEREYREREHIVAHGKKKARPSRKGKSKGG